MNLSMILEMAASNGDRAVATVGDRTLTAARLDTLARRAAVGFRNHPAVLYSGANHLAYPVALFGAALAGVPFVPLNYRLGEQQLTALKDRHPGALVLEESDLDALTDDALGEVDTSDLEGQWDGDAVAAIIYTSGTTSDPKPAILRHRHLLAYVLNTMEFATAAETDASLVSVPPYHIAGLTNLLSNFYTGRRVVYLAAFDPKVWLDTVRRENVTHAMLVPTMLNAEWGQRLVAVLVGSADPDEVRRWVKDRLRSSKTPDTIVFRDELPKTETGKLLRRNLLAELENTHA